jgi:hypothetical protein
MFKKQDNLTLIFLKIRSIDVEGNKRKVKPDLMIGLADRQRELHFFFVEINKPAISSK